MKRGVGKEAKPHFYNCPWLSHMILDLHCIDEILMSCYLCWVIIVIITFHLITHPIIDKLFLFEKNR